MLRQRRVRGPSEFLTLHVSVRDEDDGEEEEGAHDFAPPETDSASSRRRIRIRHRGFRSRGNLSRSSPPVRSHPDVEDRVLRSRRSAFCNIFLAHPTSVAALKTLLFLAVSLLFTVTFTIFLTVKSSEGPLWFLRATSTTPPWRSLTVAARSPLFTPSVVFLPLL